MPRHDRSLLGPVTYVSLCGSSAVSDAGLAALAARLPHLQRLKLREFGRVTSRAVALVAAAAPGLRHVVLHSCARVSAAGDVRTALQLHAAATGRGGGMGAAGGVAPPPLLVEVVSAEEGEQGGGVQDVDGGVGGDDEAARELQQQLGLGTDGGREVLAGQQQQQL